MSGDNDKFVHGFGKGGRANPGRTRYVMRGGKLVPVSGAARERSGLMRSMAMGCVDPKEQRKRLQTLKDNGIEAAYHPTTGELCFEGGYQTQKQIARLHGLEVG